MTKKRTPPQASKQKQLRRQFGGAFGRAPGTLQHFLATDLDTEAQSKVIARNQVKAGEAELELLELMNRDPEE